MSGFQEVIKLHAISSFRNSMRSVYVLDKFYDMMINGEIYSGTNMVAIEEGKLTIYSIDEIRLSIDLFDIDDFRIFNNYQKQNYIIIRPRMVK